MALSDNKENLLTYTEPFLVSHYLFDVISMLFLLFKSILITVVKLNLTNIIITIGIIVLYKHMNLLKLNASFCASIR